MPDLADQFSQAIADSKQLAERPDNATMLKLYALYKQASNGDCTDPEPGATDFIAKAKWQAWQEAGGQSQEQAQQNYIELVESLKS